MVQVLEWRVGCIGGIGLYLRGELLVPRGGSDSAFFDFCSLRDWHPISPRFGGSSFTCSQVTDSPCFLYMCCQCALLS